MKYILYLSERIDPPGLTGSVISRFSRVSPRPGIILTTELRIKKVRVYLQRTILANRIEWKYQHPPKGELRNAPRSRMQGLKL